MADVLDLFKIFGLVVLYWQIVLLVSKDSDRNQAHEEWN